MKRINYTVICLCLLFLFAGCEVNNQPDETPAQFSLLEGNEFVMEVNRISERPEVQFPMDDLQESDYRVITEGANYNVTFSEDGQMVIVDPGSVSGQKRIDGDKYKLYELDEGVFAGGRFIVWISNNNFEAELTIYGSGVPIIKSERGNLEYTR